MNTDTLTYKGYTITIAQDLSPENPFESWDCEPPLLTYYGGHHGDFTAYGPVTDLRGVIALLPVSVFGNGSKTKLYQDFLAGHFTAREFIAEVKEQGSYREAFANFMVETYGNEPSGWRDAVDWFDTAEALLKLAGIPCYNGQSNGYSQGDSALVLAIATPEWIKTTGVNPEHAQDVCKAAFDLYGQWAWGDVYGVAEITSPEGDELPHTSCWGFYGSDHEKSGLMEHARAEIVWNHHIQKQAEEAAHLEAALCSLA